MQMFDFESHETNPTKIVRKRWCATLPIGVEGVKGEEETLAYKPAFFLPLVFNNANESLIDYSTVTFGFDLCAR